MASHEKSQARTRDSAHGAGCRSGFAMIDAMPFEGPDAPRALAAPITELALWWCALTAPESRQTTFARWLSPAEQARMQRFGTDALRVRYLIGRGTLRWLLGNALGIAPADVAIVRGVRGRPRLAAFPAIDFNVTHTGDRAMIGIARGTRVGVDIERGDRRLNDAGVARKFMTAAERAALPADADAARRQLLQRWTCKEAMSKATGDALSAPFGRIEVELAPSPRLAAGPAPYTPADWSLHSIEVPDDHFATVALWHRPDASSGAVTPD